MADGTLTICSLQWTRCNGLALVTQGAVSWQLHSLKFQAWERAYSGRPVQLYLEEATPASSCPLQKPGLLLGPDLQDVRHLLKHLVDQEPEPLPVAWASTGGCVATWLCTDGYLRCDVSLPLQALYVNLSHSKEMARSGMADAKDIWIGHLTVVPEIAGRLAL